MKGTFSALDPNAKIFQEIIKKQPAWWDLFCSDKELYINIRKDNYINIYYFGGSIAKIEFKKDFVATIHRKYLDDGSMHVAKNIGNYVKINLAQLDIDMLTSIKSRIRSEYLGHIDDEYRSEKWIQGNLVNENACYIDTEFQFNQDVEIGNLRIDLIELSNGVLSFVELKGITDNRLRNDEKRNSSIPEIIEQMKKYKMFISKYETVLQDYYNKLLEIRKSLGLSTSVDFQLKINTTPKLVIANTYQKTTYNREKRINEIIKLLDYHNIDYVITK